jgi:GNAT superfamily N-acetyltransferase
MIQIEKIDTENKSHVEEFIRLPFMIYKGVPQWVPPILMDTRVMLNRRKHPFHEHSDVDFFVARNNGKVVGRIATIVNKPYNKYHDVKQASFNLFESINDSEVGQALLNTLMEWAKERGMKKVIGPKGFGPVDGYGIQIEGYDQRAMMTMVPYHLPYYPKFFENYGFEKENDFASGYIDKTKFIMPEKVHEVARRVRERGKFHVVDFKSKRDLRSQALEIGQVYNQTFINNWEYYPLSENELKFVIDSLLAVADYRLIKIIKYEDKIVGFLFGFPDLSEAIQRHGGRINPISIIDLMLEMRRTKWVSMNGTGVLPEYYGRGGNALMYVEMEKTAQNYQFENIEMTQVAETAVQMRNDFMNLGGKIYKQHRIYRKMV